MMHSYPTTTRAEVKECSPRATTVDFIRQFARIYVILPGTAFSTMNVN